LRTLRTGDLTKALGISAKQESKLFTRLSQGGMIAQVRRGLYLVTIENGATAELDRRR
jgi:Mn-dependent DtxR family transcriptional regulator